MGIQTEFKFILPKGYVDQNGQLHRNGVMRLATATDEIMPLKNQSVQRNTTHRTAFVLSKVVVKLGNLKEIDAKVIEGLYTSDLSYLQSFYNQINGKATTKQKVVCPTRNANFKVEKADQGE